MAAMGIPVTIVDKLGAPVTIVGGGAPVGEAGGDLSGEYPNPTVSGTSATNFAATGTITAAGYMGVSGGATFPSIPGGSGVYLVSGNGNSSITLANAGAAVGNQRATFEFGNAGAFIGFRNEQTGVGVFALSYTGGAAAGISGITSNSGSGAWTHSGNMVVNGTLQPNGLLVVASGAQFASRQISGLPTPSAAIAGTVFTVSNGVAYGTVAAGGAVVIAGPFGTVTRLVMCGSTNQTDFVWVYV